MVALRVVVVLVLASLALASASMHVVKKDPKMTNYAQQHNSALDPKYTSSQKDCEDCANYMLYVVNVVMNEILDGEITTCGELCKHANGTIIEHDACLATCDLIGIKELIAMINKTDPSPIFYCQELHYCAEVAFNPNAMNVTSLYVSPTVGMEGTMFQIFYTYTVFQNTSSGINFVTIYMPDSNSEGGYAIVNGMAPGDYSMVAEFQTEKHGMPIGEYQVGLAFCAGDCTPAHPYSGLYANVGTFFNVTKNNSTASAYVSL